MQKAPFLCAADYPKPHLKPSDSRVSIRGPASAFKIGAFPADAVDKGTAVHPLVLGHNHGAGLRDFGQYYIGNWPSLARAAGGNSTDNRNCGAILHNSEHGFGIRCQRQLGRGDLPLSVRSDDPYTIRLPQSAFGKTHCGRWIPIDIPTTAAVAVWKVGGAIIPLRTPDHPLPGEFTLDRSLSFDHSTKSKFDSYGDEVSLEVPFQVTDLIKNTLIQVRGVKLDLDLPGGRPLEFPMEIYL